LAPSATGGIAVVAFGGDARSGALFGGDGIEATGGLNKDGSRALAGQFFGDVDVTGCLRVAPGTPSSVQFGSCPSDVRLKKNIEAFPAVLDKIVQLQPVTYNWRTEEFPQRSFPSDRATGLIAQEVEKVFPEMVSSDEAGYKRVNYGELPYLMLQAIRELKAQNDELKVGTDELKAENDNLRQRIQRLEEAAPKP
jgi:Chaperone of endosialidase